MRFFLLMCFAAMVLATTAAGAGQRAADSFNLHAVVAVTASSTQCPPSGPSGAECYEFRGSAVVPGLGRVTYVRGMFTVDAVDGPGYACPHLTFGPVAMSVARKGQINFSISVDPACNGIPTGFVITGGTGDFTGASGSGAFVPAIVQSGQWIDTGGDDQDLDADDILGEWRFETWAGSLTVPGYTFDLTPPAISGAHSKTVTAPKGAKHVRVRFSVTAKDAVDGSVAVRCNPRSGSLFRIGRTGVKCSATDSSANKATARFTVTVRHRR